MFRIKKERRKGGRAGRKEEGEGGREERKEGRKEGKEEKRSKEKQVCSSPLHYTPKILIYKVSLFMIFLNLLC